MRVVLLRGVGGSVLLTLLLICVPVALPQGMSARVEISPANPNSADVITFILSGIWPDGCVPQSPRVSVSGGQITIDTKNPSLFCTQALTPWELTGSIGDLAPGDYTVIAVYSGASGAPALTIARESFTVAPSSAFNELILPVVVNGSVTERLHYQTLFTVLNTTTQRIRARLQVYGNDGSERGVFCSPIAPPPSEAAFDLEPDAQFFRFTSADLPFMDGWGHLTWEGPSSLLASEEVTLAVGAPSPCLLVCNRPSSEKLSSTQLAASKPAHQFRLPVTLNRFRQTGLAIVNPSGADTITVKVAILDATGARAQLGVTDSFEITVGPRKRMSKLLWTLATQQSAPSSQPPSPEDFQGSLVLSSDAPFAVGALNIMLPEGKFVSIPVTATNH